MSIFDLVFGCSHQRCSFPITVRSARHRTVAASLTGTYVVCLDCGKEYPYDWKEMKVIRKGGASAVAVPVPHRAA
jgi:RNase P subunit RPR2